MTNDSESKKPYHTDLLINALGVLDDGGVPLRVHARGREGAMCVSGCGVREFEKRSVGVSEGGRRLKRNTGTQHCCGAALSRALCHNPALYIHSTTVE